MQNLKCSGNVLSVKKLRISFELFHYNLPTHCLMLWCLFQDFYNLKSRLFCLVEMWTNFEISELSSTLRKNL